MNPRRELILEIIIKEHIQTGQPVGSSGLVEKYDLGVSPATVRNDMAALEKEEFITQPHTSAGRVPTEMAYQYYLDKILDAKRYKKNFSNLGEILREHNESTFKEAAKKIAGITDNTVFWAFHRNNLYYTGISSLLQQPEFRELEQIYDISMVIDRIDEIIDGIFEKVGNGVTTFIGSRNPFGPMCATLVVKYRLSGKPGLFGILGPMRMDYERNLGLANYVFERISDAK